MFGKGKKKKRFIVKEEQGLVLDAVYIVVDTHTGVNYIMQSQGGMTPLLDSEGNVVIDNKNDYLD